MNLSEQLSALTDRTRTTEDTVRAALEKDKAKLSAQREKLKNSAAAAVTADQIRAENAKARVDGTVESVRDSLDTRVAAIGDHADERLKERDKAQA